MFEIHLNKFTNSIATIIVTTMVVCLITFSALGDKTHVLKPSKESQKALKQAERLQSNIGKATEARTLIKEALSDSIMANEAKPYYVAGKIETSVYADCMKRLSINRNDPNVDRVAMADALISARRNYIKALEHDTTIDTKGKVHTHYSAQIAEWLSLQTPQYYNSGISYLNKKLYYPQAYDAFMIFASSPEDRWYDKNIMEVTDSARAKSYYYAGVMAYNAKQYKISADAFAIARNYKYPLKELLMNEMICYKNMADADTTLLPQAMQHITQLAYDGVKRFGIQPALFLEKYIAGCLWQHNEKNAIATIDSLLPIYPNDSTMLYTRRAELYLALNDSNAAIHDYTHAVSDTLAPAATLLATSKLYTSKGIVEIEKTQGKGKAVKRKNKKIIEEWLRPALFYAERAKEKIEIQDKGQQNKKIDKNITNDILTDLENTIATIHYYMLQ